MHYSTQTSYTYTQAIQIESLTMLKCVMNTRSVTLGLEMTSVGESNIHPTFLMNNTGCTFPHATDPGLLTGWKGGDGAALVVEAFSY